MKWTPEQQNAIEADGCSLLISAAAGSGKTAVLTERVARKLLDRENPCKPEELLVVTFTNAAAAEMRLRICNKIAQAAKDHPGDPFFAKLRARMDNARICTIDSFCIRLVREHFHEADIAPDFRLMDDGEGKLLQRKVIAQVLEQLHTEKDTDFVQLCAMFEQGQSDDQLAECILQMHHYCSAYPFAEQWLNGVLDFYTSSHPQDSIWGKILLDRLKTGLQYCISLYDRSLCDILGADDLTEKYEEFLKTEKYGFELALQAANEGWNAAVAAMSRMNFATFPILRKPSDPVCKDAVKARRDYCKKEFAILAALLPADSEEHEEDLQVLRPVVRALVRGVRLFSAHLLEEKHSLNAYDFSDITSFALGLLVRNENGIVTRTPLAEELCNEFKEILVDEYQDTNEAQDMLFRALSKDETNLFTVGDVKQSIYKFRLAMPELFLHKAETFVPYDGGAQGSKIILGNNFRSRKGVVDLVNFVFSRIMTKQAGEMDYTKDEELVFSADYKPIEGAESEWHLLETHGQSKDEALRAQARYAADRILEFIRNKTPVRTKEGSRPASFGDFCILLRTVKKAADIFAAELQAKGIPVSYEKSGGFFETAEIRTALSFLRMLDDPYRDVDTLAVLYSPLYGFTSDEITNIRLCGMKQPLYACLQIAADRGNKKAADFLAACDTLRTIAVAGNTAGLLRELYDRTGFTSVVFASDGGEVRFRNLLVLLEYAADFDKNIGTGLFGFLRYIDGLIENGQKLDGAAGAASDCGFVRIMSIHKSKGLEFPFVILANTEKEFNRMDSRKPLLISHNAGIGIRRQDRDTLRRFDTVGSRAVRQMLDSGVNAEEMRLLYVAMTRAAEHLLILTSLNKAEEKLATEACFLTDTLQPSEYRLCKANSFADWLLPTLLTHPDAQSLRTFSVVREQGLSALKVCFADEEESVQKEQPVQEKALPQEELVSEIRSRADYVYPFAILDGVPVKRTASDLYSEKFNTDFFAASKPAFLCSEGLTPAERGTAVHKFLQYCSLEPHADSPQIQAERMCAAGLLSEREVSAIDFEKTAAFLQSETALRARNAQQLHREMQFTIAVGADEFVPELPDFARDENTVVIGKIDMLFVEDGQAVIVDYKTDRVKSPDALCERYAQQLRMYARAATEILGVPVKEAVLFSIHLGQTVNVDIKDEKK
ncbi:MAG: helicase-exonuclease AddAB subunit AddA [Clostridia bacterium]|nr:helicase-exonuclease AddAB subunit AddA [Clostridia bacterium]